MKIIDGGSLSIPETLQRGPVRTLAQQMPQPERGNPQMWTYDVECFGLNPAEPALIVFHQIGGETHIFSGSDCRVEARGFIDSLMGGHIFYAHNGNAFDIYSLFTLLEIVNMKKLAGGSSVYEFVYVTPRMAESGRKVKRYETVRFRDSRQLLSVPLSALGAKGVTPEKFTDPEHPLYGDFTAIDDLDVEYCVQDCRVLAEALTTLRDSFREWTQVRDAGLPLTSASLAYRTWCARSWPAKWSHEDKNRVSFPMRADEVARQAYFGGRVEVLGGVDGQIIDNIVSIDRNSMFPTEMRNQVFPNPDKIMRKPATITNLRGLRERGLPYWCRLRMTAKDGADLFLPQIIDKKLNFNSPTFDGALMWPEINRALNNGWKIDDVDEIWFSREVMRPFREHVDFFYDMRKEMKSNADPRELFVKIGPLNSLYGKFGSRDRCERVEDLDRVEEISSDPDYLESWDEYLWNIRDPSLFYLVSKDETIQPRCVFTPWAAGVTSYARCNQADAIQACRDAGLQVAYTDTDSVHIYGMNDLEVPVEIGPELGEWGYEFADDHQAPAAFGVYWERKAYVWRHADGSAMKIRHKGARNSDGDLTKPQTNIRVMQYRQAMRMGLDAGTEYHEIKRSKKWCDDDEA